MWLGIVVKKFKASIWKPVSGRSLWVWVLHGLHNEFKAVQEYTERSYLKKKTKWKQNENKNNTSIFISQKEIGRGPREPVTTRRVIWR